MRHRARDDRRQPTEPPHGLRIRAGAAGYEASCTCRRWSRLQPDNDGDGLTENVMRSLRGAHDEHLMREVDRHER